MTSVLSRGLAAGAVGTTLLNAVTWLDMALTGRPASDAQDRTTAAVLDAVGLTLPADDNRRTAYGALGGIAAGLGVGVASSAVRSLGLQVPAPVGAVLTGAAALAATDAPMAATGVSDPRDWSGLDWVRDVVPHLAYGVGVRWTLDRLSAHDETVEVRREEAPVTLGVLARSLALGVATGGRSSLGLTAPLARTGRVGTLAAAGLFGSEAVADKLPQTPSRLEPPGLASRLGAGALGGAWVARRQGAATELAALAGVAGALVGTVAGAAWREVQAERGSPLGAALAEDGVALALAWWAVRG